MKNPKRYINTPSGWVAIHQGCMTPSSKEALEKRLEGAASFRDGTYPCIRALDLASSVVRTPCFVCNQ